MRRRTARIARVFLLVGLCLPASAGLAARQAEPAPPQRTPAPPSATEPQRWVGQVELPGMQLDFSVTFTPLPDASGHAGTLDIPLQGLSAGPLSRVVVSPESIAFTLEIPGAPEANWPVFEFTPDEGGGTATGVIRQSGMEFPASMRRVEAGEDAHVGPRRPQHPVPPFPYEQREVEYVNPADGTRLAGTLTVPPGPGPHPAALLITGSGPQDRDESLLGHKPFLVLADHLTRRGIAVLRVDDRGVGGSTGDVSQASADVFAGDALAGVEFLAAQPGIDPARIGLIGHSEGGIVGPLAASRSERVAFVVMLAGTGLPGEDILRLQLADVMRASGADEETIARQGEAQGRLFELLRRGASDDELRAAVDVMVRDEVARSGQPADDATIQAAVAAQMAALTSPWFRSFLVHDPRPALRQVRCPVLALNGSLDVQVAADVNLAEIAAALEEGGNPDHTAVKLDGLNHLFQTAQTGGVEEYAMIEETFAPAALDLIAGWIRARVGLE